MTISQKIYKIGKKGLKNLWIGFCDFLLLIFGLIIVALALGILGGIVGGIGIFLFNIPVKAWHESIPLGWVMLFLIGVILQIGYGLMCFWKMIVKMWNDIDNL